MNLQRENLNSNSKMNTYFLKRRTVCIIALLHLLFGVNAGKHFYIFKFCIFLRSNIILSSILIANWGNDKMKQIHKKYMLNQLHARIKDLKSNSEIK